MDENKICKVICDYVSGDVEFYRVKEDSERGYILQRRYEDITPASEMRLDRLLVDYKSFETNKGTVIVVR